MPSLSFRAELEKSTSVQQFCIYRGQGRGPGDRIGDIYVRKEELDKESRGPAPQEVLVRLEW